MKIVHIKDWFVANGFDLDSISLGDFDRIGEYTARKERAVDDPNYKKVGWSFRPAYERGILIYALVSQLAKKQDSVSVLEIGFGRGYSSLCAAKALHDSGKPGRVMSIDIAFDQSQIERIKKLYPTEWWSRITFAPGKSTDVLPRTSGTFDLIYIDGDHSYEGTKADWELCRDKFKSFCLFDDYHLPSKNDPGIKCAKAIDEIDERAIRCSEKELIRLDRRIFLDDRGLSDEQVDYGQVLLRRLP